MTGGKKKRTRLLPMEELQNRPCEVDGRPALFHRWVEEDRALVRINCFTTPEEQAEIARKIRLSGVYPAGCTPEVIRETFALVEYRDGTVAKVKPELIRFIGKEKAND